MEVDYIDMIWFNIQLFYLVLLEIWLFVFAHALEPPNNPGKFGDHFAGDMLITSIWIPDTRIKTSEGQIEKMNSELSDIRKLVTGSCCSSTTTTTTTTEATTTYAGKCQIYFTVKV